MTDRDRLIWAAVYAAAFESEVRSLGRGGVVVSTDIAVRASAMATDALAALHDAFYQEKLTRLASLSYEEFVN